MALRFILGRSGSGKTSFCLNEIAEKQQSSENELIYIVPEQFSLQAEKSILRFSSQKAMLNAQVLSFNRLAYNVFKKTGVSKTELLDDMGKSLVVAKIINNRRSEFKYFSSGCDKTGFADQLKLTLTELFKYSISPDDIEKCASQSDTVLQNKLFDTAMIYNDYMAFLESGYISADDTLDMLYKKIDGCSFLQGCEVWIDGFSGFTPQELRIIQKLIEICKNVSVALTMSKSAYENELSMPSLFYEPKETLKSIRKSASVSGLKELPPVILEKPVRFKAKSLLYLEEGLTKFVPQAHENCSAVHLYRASSRFDEATNVACHILDTVKNKSIRFADIAVLTGDISSYADTLRAIFAECGIPFFMDNKRELLSMPFVVFMTSLLDAAINSMNYESVFTLLKTGLFPMQRNDVELMENYVLAHGIRGSMWRKEWKYKDLAENAALFEKLNSLRSDIISRLDFCHKFSSKNKFSVKSICTELYTTITKLDIAATIDTLCDDFEKNSDMAKAYETRQCYNMVMDIFDTMCTVAGEDEVNLGEFKNLFESAVNSGKIGIIPPGIDNVTIGDIDRTRLPEIKLLFVIGANEGILPPAVDDSGLFTETERLLMQKSGMTLAPDSKRKAFQARFNIYSALTKAENGLYISWVQSDLTGKALQMSPVIATIKNIFPKITVLKSDDVQSKLLILSSAQCTFHRLGEALSQGGLSFYKGVLECFENDETWQRRTLALIEGACEKETSNLSDGITRKLYSGNIYSSVSRLERFASCPYLYFMTYTIGAKERPLFELGTPDLGKLFHAVIEDFTSSVEKSGISWSDLDEAHTVSMAREAVSRQIVNMENDVYFSSSAMKYLIKRVEQVSLRAVSVLTEHIKSGMFKPYAFELSFGSGSLSPIVLDIGNGRKIYLTGRIDRVDIMESDSSIYVKIIDYKSGNKDFSLQDIYYGLQLQLMLYIDALVKGGLFKDKNVLPAGAFYFRIKNPVIKGTSTLDLTDDDIKTLITRDLKMSGLVLNDERVIKGIDNRFDKTSDIIPFSYTKDGLPSASSYTADEKTFGLIMDYCVKKASLLGKDITDGTIRPKPVSTSQYLPCSFCPYSSVCGFDAAEKHVSLKKLSRDEALNNIRADDKKE